jgi:predicted metalloendopeptidase
MGIRLVRNGYETKPGDDFFRYANGAWIDKTQIPSLSGVTFQVAI